MKMLMNDATVDAIVAALMELQNAENSLLPLYEKQLRDTNNAIRNLLSAIEQGLLTRSTKERLDELEAARDSLESKIACEKISKPRISEEQLRFFLHRFRSMNVEQQSQRKMLIDTFVNAIFLYDDRLVITYNFHEGSETITLNDLHLVEKKNNSGSDIRLAGEPESTRAVICAGVLYFGNGCGHDDEEIHCLGKAQIRLGTLIQAGGFV